MYRKAWGEFSKYVRRKAADFYGIARCITCDVEAHWTLLHAGHFKHGKLDFDEMNVHPQCPRCNKWLHGKLDVYSLKLIDKYGIDAVKELTLRASMEIYKKYSYKQLEEIYEKYKKLNEAA